MPAGRPTKINVSKYLPRLTIKPKEETPGDDGSLGAAWMDALSIQLDGMELKGLRSLYIGLDHEDINVVEMEFAAEIDLDIEGVLELAAKLKEREELNSK